MKIKTTRTLTIDNIELETVKYIPETPKGIIYICHGVTGTKEAPADILKKTALVLCKNGFKVIAFDYRGHGQSGGKDVDFTIEKAQMDLDAIFKTEDNNLPIGMLGFSIGAATITLYSYFNKIDLDAVVFYSPALEFYNASMINKKSLIGEHLMKAKEDGTYEQNGYVEMPNGFKMSKELFTSVEKLNLAEYIPNLNTKLLICQAKRDQMLDFEILKEIGIPISDKYMVYDAIHALTEEKDKVIAEAVEWFNKYMGM